MEFDLQDYSADSSAHRVSVQLLPNTKHKILRARWTIKSQTEDLEWPELKELFFEEGLWESTCFEIFYFDISSTRYTEFNFSPEGKWWACRFESYRSRSKTPLRTLEVQLSSWRLDKELVFQADLPLFEETKLGVACVLKDKAGDLRYFALQHTGLRADFHRKEDAIIEISNLETSSSE